MVYLSYLYQIRFGRDEALDKVANKHLGSTNLDESEAPLAPVVKVAQYIRFSRSLKIVGPLSNALKKTNSGLAPLAEAHLAKGDGKKALSIARALDKKEASARSGYLVARALMAQERDEERREAVDLMQ